MTKVYQQIADDAARKTRAVLDASRDDTNETRIVQLRQHSVPDEWIASEARPGGSGAGAVVWLLVATPIVLGIAIGVMMWLLEAL